MKFQLALSAALATIVLASPQLKSKTIAQPAVAGKGVVSGTLPFLGSTSSKPKYRANAKRVTLKYGPINLYAKDARKPLQASLSMDPKGQGGLLSYSKGLCTDCTVLGGHYKLTYADGRQAGPKDGVYIHHIVSSDTSKRGVGVFGSCNAKAGTGAKSLRSAYFIDRGEDSGNSDTLYTTPDGKYNSGFHIGKSPRISMQYDIVNYKDEAQEIYINLDYEYVEGQVGADAGYTLQSVAGCGNGLAPKVSTTGAVSTIARIPVLSDATIIYGRGHLHAGGEKVVLRLNDKVVCTAIPTYNDAGVITSMSLCPEKTKIKAGDYITLEGVYDLTKHKLREATDGSGHGAHGKLGGSDVMAMIAMSYALG